MKVFVLIFVITGSKWGGPTTIEFYSLSECHAAMGVIQEHYAGLTPGYYAPLCIEKTIPSLSKEGGEE